MKPNAVNTPSRRLSLVDLEREIGQRTLPEPGVRYTDGIGETWEVYGKPEVGGLFHWYKIRNISTGQTNKVTWRQIIDCFAPQPRSAGNDRVYHHNN